MTTASPSRSCRRPQIVDRLLFVYDARSGVLAALVDSTRKALGSGACSLCAITHGFTGEKRAWSACRARLEIPVDYVHRDELGDELRACVGGALPAVVAQVGSRRVLLMGSGPLSDLEGSVSDFERALARAATDRGLALPGL